MARTATIPTTQEIDELARRADAGDPEAIRELGDLNNKIAKRANERMRDIERKGLAGTAAYNRAKHFIQNEDFGTGEYFSQSRKLDPDDAARNLREASTYLRYQTSTSAGEMARRADILDKLAAGNWIQMPDNKDDAAEFRRKFLDFLDTRAWDEMKKHLGDTDIIKKGSEAISGGAKISDLTRAFKDYENGQNTDLFEIWDNWTSGDKYYRRGQWIPLKKPRRK